MNLFKGILPLISVGLCCMCHLLHQVLYTRGSGLTEIYPLLNPTKHLAENWNTTDIREWIPFFLKEASAPYLETKPFWVIDGMIVVFPAIFSSCLIELAYLCPALPLWKSEALLLPGFPQPAS